jgi:tRNA threonylcarbamoyladenosine biosynthesis protein TsaE
MIIEDEGDFRLDDEAATAHLGAAIGGALEPGDTVCLFGPLGAGKSTLARGLIRALTTPDEEVPSPTFTLTQAYQANQLQLTHFDLYRLKSAAEVHELGLDEALDAGCAIIEWPERLEGALPENRLDVRLEIDGEARRARLTPHGSFEGRAIDL